MIHINKLTRILLSVVTAMFLTSMWLLAIGLENKTLENIGIGVIVLFSVLIFIDWKGQ